MKRTQSLDIPLAHRSLRLVLGLMCVMFFVVQSAAGDHPCPPPPGYVENPLSTPSITAAEVAANPTAENLRMFALSGRDYLLSVETPLDLVHASCLMRQEGGDWRSGDIFPVAVSINPQLAVNPQAPINMRVTFHARSMALAGRLVDRGTAGTILAAASANLAGGGPVPGAGGHAVLYGPFVLLVGIDIRESHLDPHVVDSHYMPQVTASEVVDRASLKIFVNEAINYLGQLLETYGFDGGQVARGALRDKNGPWISGPVYLFVYDTVGYTIFHGAFPDRYESRVAGTARDAVSGELILPQIVAAAEQDGGGFVEYHFDNPDDDSDSVDIPKLTYARKHTFVIPHPVLGELSSTYIVAAGIYQDDSGTRLTRNCANRNIAASAVKTLSDIQPFVECAAAYVAEHGTEEARRAFNEDERWKDGPTYVFVDGIAKSGFDSKTFVYPPDPSREGQLWGALIDDFGTDLFYEVYRMMAAVDAGWIYYSFPNPATGRQEPKASYVIEIDWDGDPAVIGAGHYARDTPGTCNSDEVSAATLGADPSPETLRELVRCAAMMVESQGYFAKDQLETNPRWTTGANYVFVLDMMGNQVMSGNRVRVNGNPLHEWRSGSGGSDQFGGRDMVDVGDTFGETYVYYRSYNPRTGAHQPKVGFLKRIVAHGVPLLVGAGYYVGPGPSASGSSCADNYVTAAAVHTQSDIQAFVECAAEYALEHGTEEARRAFNEDQRWKSGPTYVFVDGLAESGEDSLTYVFPPDPAREGSVWGTSIDGFGSDYFFELHRIMSNVDSGWIYYAFNNPATERRQPKSSYVIEIDWNGDRAAIGAGIYARDFPGTCEPGEVNAADLEANADDRRLREFVNCAALTVESSGYFAGPVLSENSRWKHGSIYIFGINVETGVVEFSGNASSFATSGRIPELLFDGRNAIEAAAVFGEGFWYYNFDNPATGESEPKVAFTKLVRAQGVPLLVGSGYNPGNR